jgi:hypothetical protein
VTQVLEAYSAGSPTDAQVKWTDLTPLAFAGDLVHQGYEVCRNTAAELLETAGFAKRKLRKELITGYVDPGERNAQFEHIAVLRASYQERGLPVFGVDTKKKELLGLLYTAGGAIAWARNGSMIMSTGIWPRAWPFPTGSMTLRRTSVF